MLFCVSKPRMKMVSPLCVLPFSPSWNVMPGMLRSVSVRLAAPCCGDHFLADDGDGLRRVEQRLRELRRLDAIGLVRVGLFAFAAHLHARQLRRLLGVGGLCLRGGGLQGGENGGGDRHAPEFVGVTHGGHPLRKNGISGADSNGAGPVKAKFR